MALKHGNKTYLQILLDPHRAKLVQQQAKAQGIRATAWIREAVYKELERELPASVYQLALADDQAVWRKSVRSRVEGRDRSKPQETEKDAVPNCPMPEVQ